MAVNIDTVYKTVLLILNKEQRGYMTPDEFNKTATQVQLSIFNNYFEDLNQQLRIPDNDTEYSDRIKNLQEKIAIFEELGECDYVGPYFNIPNTSSASVSEVITTIDNVTQYPLLSIDASALDSGSVRVTFNGIVQSADQWSIVGSNLFLSSLPVAGVTIVVQVFPFSFYKLGTVIYNDEKEVQYVQANELIEMNLSKLTEPTLYYPVYRYKDFKIYVYPQSITSNISATYIRRPLDPVWNFSASPTTGQYIYDAASSVNFELHPTEQVNLISQILMYSGVIIRDPQIIQVAAQQVQSEKINEKS
jgi:hypothetical protein